MLKFKNKKKKIPDLQKGPVPSGKGPSNEKGKQESVNKEEKTKKRKQKVKREGKSPLVKWGLRVVVGICVILLQVGISYTIVSKFLVSKSSEESEDGSQPETSVVQSNVQNKTRETISKEPEPTEPVDISFDNMDFTNINGVYTLADFVINPANTQGQHFLVVSMVFTFEDKKLADLIKVREPILQDRILDLLSKRSFNWLSTHENKNIIRAEVIALTKALLETSAGIQIYFTKYVLQ